MRPIHLCIALQVASSMAEAAAVEHAFVRETRWVMEKVE